MQALQSNSSSNSNVPGKWDGYYCSDHLTGPLVWAAFSGVIFLLGLPSSVAVLWELIQGHRSGSRSPTNNTFIVSLTIMDIIFNIFIPLSIFNYLIWHNVALENFCNFLYCFTMSGRPLLMACLSMDWYLAVVHPVTYISSKSIYYRRGLLIGIWVYTILFGVLLVIFKHWMNSFLSISVYCLMLFILLLCNLSILRILKRSGPGSRNVHPVKRKAIQTITNNLGIALLSYLPPVLVYSLKTVMYFPEYEFFCYISITMLIGPMAGGCVMPLLYLWNTGKWRCCWHKN